MTQVFIHLGQGKIRASHLSKAGFKTSYREVAPFEFTEDFFPVISESIQDLLMDLGAKKNSVSLIFLLDPKHTVSKFITVTKSNTDPSVQIINEVKSKLKDFSVEDLYFSYNKIAPFVYQFIGVQKDVMSFLTKVSTSLGYSISGIFGWSFLIPKYLKQSDPFISLVSQGDLRFLLLSEFGGVFHAQPLERGISVDELSAMISEAASFKRDVPISKFYCIGGKCELTGINMEEVSPPKVLDTFEDFTLNIVSNYVLDLDPSELSGHLNLLTFLPLPVPARKDMKLAYVGGTAGALMVVSLLLFFFVPNLLKNKSDLSVLSDSTSETTPSGEISVPPATSPVEAIVVVSRGDVSLRVENGAGISGIAAKSRDFLVKLGYKVPEIGNALESTVPTILQIKPSKISYRDILMKDLSSNFGTLKTSELAESSQFDAVIVVGSEVNPNL